MHPLRQIQFLDGDIGLRDLGHEGADGVDAGDIDRESDGGGREVGAGDDEDIVELSFAETGLGYGVGRSDKEEDEEEEEKESEGGRVEEAVKTVECHEWRASGDVLLVLWRGSALCGRGGGGGRWPQGQVGG